MKNVSTYILSCFPDEIGNKVVEQMPLQIVAGKSLELYE
jgi:hypothetical protein